MTGNRAEWGQPVATVARGKGEVNRKAQDVRHALDQPQQRRSFQARRTVIPTLTREARGKEHSHWRTRSAAIPGGQGLEALLQQSVARTVKR